MNSRKSSFFKKTLFLTLFCITSSLFPMDMQLINNNRLHQIIMGEFSLLNAAQTNNEKELTKWIELGVNTNAKKTYNGFTSLHFAANFNYLGIGKILLDNNKTLKNPQDYNENTPLHIAVLQKHIPFIDLLLQYGADQTIKNYDKRNPLTLLLIEADAKRELQDEASKVERKQSFIIHKRLLIAHLNTKIGKKS